MDDDPHIVKSLKLYLELEDFHVTTASSGGQAMDRLLADPPDLLILDVIMPMVDGFQVLDRMKAQASTSRIAVVMLTAKSQDADVLKGHAAGVAAYVTKPVNYNELVDTIHLIFKHEEMEAHKVNS